MSDPLDSDKLDWHRNAIRQAGFKINPWRLGIWVGEAGDDIASPYVKPKSAQEYKEGVRDGQRRRQAALNERKAAQ